MKKIIEQIERDRALVGNTETTNYCSKKQGKQCKKWVFTLNNYTLEQIEHLERILHVLCCKYIFQEETGETGTKHLQGVIWLKKRMRLTELKKNICSESHWEICRSWEHSRVYCSKLETRTGRIFSKEVKLPRKPIKIIDDNKLYDWQKEIIEIVKDEPHDRRIFWYWERLGNTGKSTFCKYLCVKYNALVLSGKATDMKHGIVKYVERHGDYPELIIFDVPRTVENFLSYTGIEEVKNGLFFSSKYESDMIIGNPPHLFIFANFRPDTDKMSLDRWKVRRIGHSLSESFEESDGLLSD